MPVTRRFFFKTGHELISKNPTCWALLATHAHHAHNHHLGDHHHDHHGYHHAHSQMSGPAPAASNLLASHSSDLMAWCSTAKNFLKENTICTICTSWTSRTPKVLNSNFWPNAMVVHWVTPKNIQFVQIIQSLHLAQVAQVAKVLNYNFWAKDLVVHWITP